MTGVANEFKTNLKDHETLNFTFEDQEWKHRKSITMLEIKDIGGKIIFISQNPAIFLNEFKFKKIQIVNSKF